ncbi:ribonuclease H [Trifolium pratense]|uniref:Ribonuclease H n=1 Tax=Trifolium pratense TaxID=57577 RepID=A0A2K3LAV4_TRIPR|nr:ribonuclease H [Trifolium pratense]
MDQSQDKLLWKHTDSGDLELKEAYQFKMQQYQDLHWAQIIWSSDIPPSKSLLVWRLMHGKVPTDENLMLRGNALCGGIFRNHEADFIYGFFETLGVASFVFAELCGAMRAIEIAYRRIGDLFG